MAFSVSDAARAKLTEIKSRYPDPRSAVMAALYIVQEENGEIGDEAVAWVSGEVGIPAVHVLELVTFYTMYRRKAAGKYHVQVCKTLSCGLRGAKEISDYLHERFQTEPGQVTGDGKFSFDQVECLGSCGSAPMCQINDRFFENLNVDEMKRILDRIEKEEPNLSLSTVNETLGDGLKDLGFSQVGKLRE